MTDLEQYIDEYGVPEPVAEAYGSYEEFNMAYTAWFEGLIAYINQGEAGAAAQQDREEEEARAVQEVDQLPGDGPETSDRYQIGDYIDAAGNVWSSSGELLSGDGTLTDSYVDQAGHMWSMEYSNPAEQAAGEVETGDPTVDTALLLLDLLDALTGEEGMTSDVDGIQEAVEGVQRVLEHPVMTTSFQDYTVTEGLLLLLLLYFFITSCIKIIKEGFSWLR